MQWNLCGNLTFDLQRAFLKRQQMPYLCNFTLCKHIPLSREPDCLMPKGSSPSIWLILSISLLTENILYLLQHFLMCSLLNFLFWTSPLLCQPFFQTYKHKSMALMTNVRGDRLLSHVDWQRGLFELWCSVLNPPQCSQRHRQTYSTMRVCGRERRRFHYTAACRGWEQATPTCCPSDLQPWFWSQLCLSVIIGSYFSFVTLTSSL